MKQGSTIFLKAVLIGIGLTAGAVSVLVLPGVAARDAAAHPETAYLQYPFLACAFTLSALFISAVYQAYKVLGYIDRNQVYSELSVLSLRTIKRCAAAVCVLIAAGSLFVICFMEGDRAGVLMLGFIGTFVSGVIAAFAAVMQKIFKDGIELKSENELII